MNENQILNRLVNAMREVAASPEREVEEGRRAAQIDAHDLMETLLAIADRLAEAASESRLCLATTAGCA